MIFHELTNVVSFTVVLPADDSTSMKYADDGARILDLKMILDRVTEVATLFDHDGLSIRAINRYIYSCNMSHSFQDTYTIRFCQGRSPLRESADNRIVDCLDGDTCTYRETLDNVLQRILFMCNFLRSNRSLNWLEWLAHSVVVRNFSLHVCIVSRTPYSTHYSPSSYIT